jgi:hypothetical protein
MGMSPQNYEYLLVAANLAHFHQKRGFSIKVSKWKLLFEGHWFAKTNCMGKVKIDTKKLDLNACINGVSPKLREQVYFIWIDIINDYSRRGASLGGAQSNVFNPTLRLFSPTCLHISLILVYIRQVTTTCGDGTKSTNNRQPPSPWWWSRSPLQRRGFDEPTPPEEWAALRMLVPMPPSKRFNRSNKLM